LRYNVRLLSLYLVWRQRRTRSTSRYSSQTTTIRSVPSTSLGVRRTRLSTVGARAFPVAVARLWNSLPSHVTAALCPSSVVSLNHAHSHIRIPLSDSSLSYLSFWHNLTFLCKSCRYSFCSCCFLFLSERSLQTESEVSNFPIISHRIEAKFGTIVPQINMHWLTKSEVRFYVNFKMAAMTSFTQQSAATL